MTQRGTKKVWSPAFRRQGVRKQSGDEVSRLCRLNCALPPKAVNMQLKTGTARVSRAVLGVSPSTPSARKTPFRVSVSNVRFGQRDADPGSRDRCATHFNCIVTPKGGTPGIITSAAVPS
jgi:hypothetical protein